MDVRAVTAAPELRPPPLPDESRHFATKTAGEGPPEKDIPLTQWVSPSQERNDIREFTKHLAEIVNEAMQDMKFSLQFVVDNKTEEITVKVLDGKGQLVRQIPSDEIQQMRKRLAEMAGLLFDKKGT
jgi:uncharacterized FlaG/YvyC family protein